MAEQHSGNKDFNKEELPIPIPPADQAWQSMLKKLDAELPAEGKLPAPAPARYIWVKGLSVVAVVAIIGLALWQYSHNNNRQLPSSGNNVADTSLAHVQTVSSGPDNHTQPISEQTDTASGYTTSSATDKAPGAASNTHPSAHSQAAEAPRSSQVPGALPSSPSQQTSQGSGSSASLSPSLASNRKYTAERTSTRLNSGEITTGKKNVKPLAIAEHPLEENSITKQLAKNKRQSKLSASDSNYTAKTDAALIPSTSTTVQAPSPISAYTDSHATKTAAIPSTNQVPTSTHANNQVAEQTLNRSTLQLSTIHAPVTGYNTSLQHEASQLTLHPHHTRERAERWAVYAQLNITLPLYNSSSYFMGPNGKDQFYRYLIPSVRIERKLWRGALSLDVQPTVAATPKFNKYKVGHQSLPYDTLQSLLKQFGSGIALQYQLPIRPKWQLGAGVQALFLQQAVVRQTIMDSMRVAKTSVFKASAADKQELSKVRINGTVELDYMAGKWQFGLRAIVPLTRVSKTKDIPTGPLNAELIVRRRLWRR
ncbi:hypothetical protein [Chitinophaga filiformis]|uniref:Outer membrane protein beta-barrel domain-containing protein n=1 Tax=Chitinophaga filiformis TaxID=104663 RepID=A0ABY4I811_CHIFI|nr:hypothetical protein [Chitinophaga filiformis]UPK71788.1 hypothetical protein MYF79_10890 [Chitinophaga filiformis]